VDLSKAFDTLTHAILFGKLSYYGIQNCELSLIQSYLGNRKQQVVIGNKFSDTLEVKAGVPQGSILGPFLFLVFINDFSFNVPTQTVLYADDTTLIRTGDNYLSVETHLNHALNCAKLWYRVNNLTINEEKTEFIYFSLKKTSLIDDCKSVNLLGIHIDTKLSWDHHITNLCKKLARITYLLRKLRSCVSLNVLIMTYYGIFHSQLLYGLRLWGGSSYAQKAFIWQKKALRAMLGLLDHDSCKQHFSKLNILSLPSMYILSNLIFVKNNPLKFSSHFHTYNTRHRSNLVTPQIRLSKSLNSHPYMQYTIFNKLPLSTRELPSRLFKTKIEAFLKMNAFYTVGEFLNSDTSCLE